MTASLKRLTTLAGITCAIVGTGPVALAAPAAGTAGQTPLPGQSCSVNQGLPAGVDNLGPTGPMGPLGSKGPLGGNNTNLPGGPAACDLGPAGPLGPGGALGSPSPAAQNSPQNSPARQTRPGKKQTKHGHKGGKGTHRAKRTTARH